MTMKNLLAFLMSFSVLAAIALVAGCDNPKAATDNPKDTPPKPVVDEKPAEQRVGVGDPMAVTADGKPADANVAEGDDEDGDEEGEEDADDESESESAGGAEGNENAAAEKVIPGDWTMWGGSPSRNMVSRATGISLDFDLKENVNVKWVAALGTQTYGNPVVADGQVYVGTNNGHEYREQHKGDRGIIVCFRESDGSFLWQLTRQKLEIGQVMDWPEQGICSSPYVEGDRMWVVTNRCELMCLDTQGFYDDENDGAIQDEVDHEKQDADIIWSFDMINELGVFPHNLATSSPIVHGDYVFIVTSNGVDEAHLELPSPRAPSFICVNKKTGELVWENGDPGDRVLHGQWSSPAVAEVNGETLVFFPGGNGWCYALKASDGSIVWQFDLNPKETKWELGGAGSRNNIIATPVFFDNSIFLGVGQDPEHGEGTGHFYRIDATKTGDISAEIGEINTPGEPNPNSAMIWHYGGTDDDAGTVTGKPNEPIFRRTMSTASVHGDRVYVADLSGFVHCLDIKTGKRIWTYDTKSAIWASTMYVDGKLFLGTEDGRLIVLDAMSDDPKLIKQFDTVKFSSVYSTPVFANGNMYLTDRTRLYCIPVQ
jgi:outer membrane protein assembly factor BamB